MTSTWLAAVDGKREIRTAAAKAARPSRCGCIDVPRARFHAIELLGLGLFLVQMPFSLAAARLNYEMRWYIVTDRSLRLREGIFGVREMTLTFANVQNIAIRQGPLQRALGLADVVVRTAGRRQRRGRSRPRRARPARRCIREPCGPSTTPRACAT
jgi:hypothetical protein